MFQKRLNGRPLALCAICFALGIYIAWAPSRPALIAALALLVALIALYWCGRKATDALMLVAAALLGAAYCAAMLLPDRFRIEDWPKEPIVIEGRVVDARYMTERQIVYCTLADVGIGGVRVPYKLRLTVTGAQSRADMPVYGQRIQTQARVWSPDVAKNPGQFDSRRYYLSEDVLYCAQAELPSIRALGAGSPLHPMALSQAMRERIRGTLYEALGAEDGGLVAGMLIGDTEGLTPELEAAFEQTGLTHLLAVSGLHVVQLTAAIFFLLRLLGVGRKAQFFTVAAVLALYSLLVGLSASVVRASLMALIYLAAPLVGRKLDPLTSICASLLVILIAWPLALFSLGLQLSYGATLGIILLNKPIGRVFGKLPKYLRETLSVTLSAQIGILPLLFGQFGGVPAASVLANALLIPPNMLAMLLAYPLAIFGLIHPSLTAFFKFLIEPLLFVFKLGIDWMARLPMVRLAAPSAYCTALYAALLVCASPYLLRGKLAGRYLCAGLLAAAVAAFLAPTALRPAALDMTALSVGQGDCTVIVAPDNRAYLIDAGSSSFENVADRIVLPALRAMGIDRLEGIVVTHQHSDHINGVAALIERFPVKSLLLMSAAAENMPQDLVLAIQRTGIPVYSLETGASIDLGGDACLTVLSGRDEHDTGWPISIASHGGSALLCADLDAAAETVLLDEDALEPADVLRVAHHGAKDATGEMFLARVRPSVALISVGNNAYGHPDPGAIDRLTDSGARVYRTDRNGAVTVRLYRRGIRVYTYLSATND